MLNSLNQSNSIKEFLKPYLKGWFHRLTGITPLGNILNANYLHGRVLLRSMKGLGKSQGKGCILDIGCGTKPYKNIFEKPDSFYVGIEFSGEVKKDTRNEEPEIIADAGSLPLKNNSVDLVLINEVLEHVPHPGNVLREACRVAKGHGRVVVSMPFMYPEHADPFDYRRLTPEGLSNLIKLEGISLEVHEIHRLGGYGTVVMQMLQNLIYTRLQSTTLGLIFHYSLGLVLLPLFSLLANCLGLILDGILPDKTIYSGIFAILNKKGFADSISK